MAPPLCSSLSTTHHLIFCRNALDTPSKQSGTHVTHMELTVDQALQQGIAAHKEGKLQDAESFYRAILQAQPNHPDANHNLGILAVAAGKPIEAIPLFKLALETNPQIEHFWLSYIDALIKAERFDEAKLALVEGEKSGVASEKLDALGQHLQGTRSNHKTKIAKGQMLSEKRKNLAEKKKSKKRKFQGSPPTAGPSQDQLSHLLGHYQAGRFKEVEALAASLARDYPRHPFGWKVLGAVFQQTGRLGESLAPMQSVVKLAPQEADAHYNLGVTLKELGRANEAEASYRQAIALKPDYAEAHNNLGVTLQELGRSEEVEASYRQAIALKPDYAEAHSNLGNTLQELGRLDEAEASYRKAIALKPDYAEAHSNLGNTLQELGRLYEAEASYRKAITLRPDLAEGHSNLGVTLEELGRLDEAEASHRKAITLKPDYAEGLNNLGTTLNELGRLNEAEASYKKAIALKPDYAEAHNNLGVTLQGLGRLDEAEANCRQAIVAKPDYAEAYNNLGNTLQELGRLDEAEASYRKAIALKPDYAEAHSNLGNTLKELGKLDEAESSCRQAIAVKPDYADAHNNLLMLIGSMLFNKARYHNGAVDFARAVNETVTSRFDTWSHSRDEESLRIGFVSGDLRSHPVGYFLEGLLIELQSSPIELFAYPTVNKVDAVTSRLKPLFDMWCPLVGLNDMDAAQKIHGDGIHVLMDLSGHTAKNRLPVFAWKPAPIQVSWLGYFASTGLSEMDYILGDPYVTPREEAGHFSEQIWQLPETYLCFTPPNLDLEVASLPAYTNGFVTFGCFNNLARMTDEIVSVRASILHAVPDSKLFLKDKQLDRESGRNRVLSRFEALDIEADRLILEGKSPREEYLECYGRVDIALSPFPYGGGTTSVEGLWMGVPVITKKGSHFVSHLGESIAHNSGLSDWIASDEDEYIAKAVAFASNLESLSGLRKGMRERILATPLFDAPRFALHFEQAIRAMRKEIG